MTSSSGSDSRWPAFALCLAAGFLTLLDVTIVNVAIPSIESSLGAGPADLQWIVAGYTLAFGLVLVPAGRLGDVRGRRALFLLGLSLFLLASGICGLATSPTWLVAARVFQGLAAGLLNPQIIGYIQDLFDGSERSRAFGWYGAAVGLSTAIGPLLGGLLLVVFGVEQGWRAVFLVNVPVGVVVLVLAYRRLPRTAAASRPVSLDLLGLILLAVAVIGVMVPVTLRAEGSPDGQGGQPPWALLGVAVLAAALFVLWERRLEARGGTPVISRELARTPSYSRGALIALLYFAGFTGIFLIGTLYLQSGLGLAPWQAGMVLLPFALAGSASAALGGRWVARWGRWIVVAGLVLMLIGLIAVDVAVTLVSGPAAAWWVGGILAVAGFGNGIVISPNQALTLADVPRASSGVAAGALQTGQRMGSAIGVAASASIFFTALDANGDYARAMSLGLRMVIALLGATLLVALIDARRRPDPAQVPRR